MTLVVFVILCKICVRFLLLASSGGFLLPGAQRGFFTAERGGRRQFQLAVPCQPGRFRPHASYLRKEARCRAAAKKLLLLRLPRNITQGSADPCAIPGELVLYYLTGRASSTVFASTLALVCNCKPVCSSYNDQTAEQQIWQSSPPQGIFALQKSLRGDCGGDGVPAVVERCTARAKKFPEEICFAPSLVCQICRTPD